jgi:DNA repair protein SbcC/Rad50
MRRFWYEARQVEVAAFGPFAGEEVVDFQEAMAAGLFGIYGQTGSGKSTIFSALTFALFGEATKTDQEAQTLRSDHADPKVATEVEFIFEVGERKYVVVRRPEQTRPKQRGTGETTAPHEAYLFDATGLSVEELSAGNRGKVLAEKKTGVVDEEIRGILGYGPKQFRQIVLLPQGKFEMFLAAKTDERLAILRELFDVSIYRQVAANFKENAAAAEREVGQERDLCARQLKNAGFESSDALALGSRRPRASMRSRSRWNRKRTKPSRSRAPRLTRGAGSTGCSSPQRPPPWPWPSAAAGRKSSANSARASASRDG